MIENTIKSEYKNKKTYVKPNGLVATCLLGFYIFKNTQNN